MSLILDALKKLDREKVSRWKGMPDLAAEVIRPDPAQSRKRTPVYLLVVSLTALVTAGITYALIVKPGFLLKSAPPSLGVPLAPGQQVASASPETGPQAKPSGPVPVILPAPGQKDTPSPPGLSPPAPGQRVGAVSPKPGPAAKPLPGAPGSPVASVQKVSPAPPESGLLTKPSSSAPAQPPRPRQKTSPSSLSPESARGLPIGARPEISKVPFKTGSKPPAPSPSDKIEIPKETSREATVTPGKASKPSEPVAGSSTANPPPLKISGIVWNEEPSMRRAVINGNFVTEGSAVEGVKVVEIFPTKVRFLHQGRYFEISVF